MTAEEYLMWARKDHGCEFQEVRSSITPSGIQQFQTQLQEAMEAIALGAPGFRFTLHADGSPEVTPFTPGPNEPNIVIENVHFCPARVRSRAVDGPRSITWPMQKQQDTGQYSPVLNDPGVPRYQLHIDHFGRVMFQEYSYTDYTRHIVDSATEKGQI